jgi:hypothetical protein
LCIVHAAIDHEKAVVQEYNDLNLDLETALVAALGKKNAMYGTQTSEQFIVSKLAKWKSRLRFLHNYHTPTNKGDIDR